MPGRFLVGVSVFVVHEGAVLLLGRPADRSNVPRMWEPVHGRVEQGETPVEAAAREVREGTGLEVRALEPFHTFTVGGSSPEERLIGICFAGTVPNRDLELSGNHTKSRWTPIGRLGDARLAEDVKTSVTAFHARWGPGGAEFDL